MANSDGQRKLPRGTPDMQLTDEDESAPTATYCFRPEKKDCSQLRAVCRKLNLLDMRPQSVLWSIDTLCMSQKVPFCHSL